MPTDLSQPPLLLTRSDVARLLELPLRQLTWWVWALREDRQYDQFELARRGGGPPREIQAPIKPIKDIQRRLATVLTRCYEPPVHVHGFVPTRSPTTNAQLHQRQQWILRIDLRDFFPSIHFGRVRGMFMAFPFEYPPDVATLLAQICCFHRRLPQGAPTSPIVSNFICRRMDTQLAQLARTERSLYTRYADDLCFSTDRTTFPTHLASMEAGTSIVGRSVADIIVSNGFEVHGDKTHLMRRTQRQRVTGLVVNAQVNVPRNYVRSLRNLLYIWHRHGEEAAEASFARFAPHSNWPPEKPRPDFRSSVRGRVQYVGAIKGWSDPVYLRLASSLRELDASFVPSIAASPAGPFTVRLFTEGESDLRHIAAAKRFFEVRGEFTELAFDLSDQGAQHGADRLLEHCRALAVTQQPTPCVCLFDTDQQRTLRQAVGRGGWKNWGNGVAAVALVPPPWRDPTKPVCIEMLYPGEILERSDAQGRRVFLLEEFDRSSGHHSSRKYTTPNPQNRHLVREVVHEIATGASVALSKMDFAESVESSTPPFSDIDFEGFRPTFEAIREAVQAIAAVN